MMYAIGKLVGNMINAQPKTAKATATVVGTGFEFLGFSLTKLAILVSGLWAVLCIIVPILWKILEGVAKVLAVVWRIISPILLILLCLVTIGLVSGGGRYRGRRTVF